MRRYFNTEGQCEPDVHYMVGLEERLERMKRFYIDREKYFLINKGRQYGKTTTLCALENYLADDYLVISMDFQGITTEEYRDESVFTKAFIKMFTDALKEGQSAGDEKESIIELLEKSGLDTLSGMFDVLSRICKMASKPVVVMIDEVDSASNNQVFLDFLALLRQYYIKRRKKPVFHSVILAGVYDIKNLKRKIRPDGEHQYNSPWNIAAEFDIDMSFSASQISSMLWEYEKDNGTGMNVEAVAQEIYEYTSGYPYLVSAICKIMDEKLPDDTAFTGKSKIWTSEGIGEAVKIILKSRISLFDSMIKHISEYPDMKQMLYAILFCGEQVMYNQDNHTIELAHMFGYIREDDVNVQIANRIFETRLYNYYLSEEELTSTISHMAKQDKNQFVKNKRLQMELVLEKFVEYFNEIYGDNDEKFMEAHGRKFFLLYLKPIINGTGNYYIEAQTRDARRTDVIIDYLGEQFVIELKIWRGNEYNERGEEQLLGYLDYFHLKTGYMLSFNFNKEKETGVKEITVNGKTIVEAVV